MVIGNKNKKIEIFFYSMSHNHLHQKPPAFLQIFVPKAQITPIMGGACFCPRQKTPAGAVRKSPLSSILAQSGKNRRVLYQNRIPNRLELILAGPAYFIQSVVLQIRPQRNECLTEQLKLLYSDIDMTLFFTQADGQRCP